MSLKDWIIRNRGHKPDHLIMQELLMTGWTKEVIDNHFSEITGQVLHSKPILRANQLVTASFSRNEPIVEMVQPYPKIKAGNNTINCGDVTVNVLLEVKLPKLVVVDNFMTPKECFEVISGAASRLSRSTVVESNTGGSVVDDVRTSEGMFYAKGENETISKLEARMSAFADWPIANGESLQVLKYKQGAQYKPHNDYFSRDDAGNANTLNRGGNRIATVLVYLNDVVSGGGTVFPEMGIEVRPKRGTAIFFSYNECNASTMTLHGGSPVIEGEKWVAVKWFREKEFV